MTSEPPNLAAFVASLSSAWHAGEIRPTFSIEAKPRTCGACKDLSPRPTASPVDHRNPVTVDIITVAAKLQEKPRPVYAKRGRARIQALRTVWPIVCRRLEGLPNINAVQMFEELCIQFPADLAEQYSALLRRINRWRGDTRARGVVIGPKTYRRLSEKPRGRRPRVFSDIGRRWRNVLEENRRIRLRWSCSANSRPAIQDAIAYSNSTRCRNECERGDNTLLSG